MIRPRAIVRKGSVVFRLCSAAYQKWLDESFYLIEDGWAGWMGMSGNYDLRGTSYQILLGTSSSFAQKVKRFRKRKIKAWRAIQTFGANLPDSIHFCLQTRFLENVSLNAPG
jgi:hypothetical protein